eukprot:CAMPEP_0184683160 /NCGR_PEP_ID=MMETSP0312-20130426/10097_1 /TAXON_ID=31354 /ORGANISM="Compsopogon coeruleus, Strain SAG 36.94" /LENGTH=242 /DNA_ID=CAMNT_0027135269 /DNA_START=230 /DNA_END=958 /DNA_ORIENTATION=+
MARPPRAFAKLQGPNFVYYLQKYKVTIGRTSQKLPPEEQPEIVFDYDDSISRQHAIIAYSPSEQAFELTVLGKNGLLVNGNFVSRDEKPIRLRSQTEIILGKVQRHHMTITFLLPSSKDDEDLRKKIGKRKGTMTLVEKVAQALMSEEDQGNSVLSQKPHVMSFDDIVQYVLEMFPDTLSETLGGEFVVRNSIRHALVINGFFEVVTAGHKKGWRIHPDYVRRFIRLRGKARPTKRTRKGRG